VYATVLRRDAVNDTHTSVARRFPAVRVSFGSFYVTQCHAARLERVRIGLK